MAVSANVKVGVPVALAAALLVYAYGHTSGTSSDYSANVPDYHCTVTYVAKPSVLHGQVTATIGIACPIVPKTTDLHAQLQYRPTDADPWHPVGSAMTLVQAPTAAVADLDVKQPCQGGLWRVEYTFGGTGAASGKPIVSKEGLGDSVTISAADCSKA